MNVIEKLKAGVLTHSPQEMQELAFELAGHLGEESVVCLHGDLGAG